MSKKNYLDNNSIAKKKIVCQAISIVFYKKYLHMSFSTDSEIKPAAPPVRPLFRQQAITHISTKQYGTVILAKSFSHRFLTTSFVLIAFGIIAFFMFFSTTRKAQTSGVLLTDTGVIRVIANQSGFVTEKRVSEGQLVKAGDVLFVLQNKQNTKDSTFASLDILG